MEMLFDGRRNRCVDRVCNYFHCNHFGRVCVCRNYGTACGGNVYAYAGRYFLFVYLGKHKIPVCEKGVHRKRRQTERTRGRASKSERHQGKRAYRIQRRVLRQSNQSRAKEFRYRGRRSAEH